MKRIGKHFTLVMAVAVVISCNKDQEQAGGQANTGGGAGTPGPSTSLHLTMGNPSNAVADISQSTNYLITKTQYCVSYHKDRGIPNWVSWHLDPSWLGTARRQDDFRTDELPAGWYRVQDTDYSQSGFDRGHHCPSADRTYSDTDNSATFLMTNIFPQAPVNNQQTWGSLENYCRTLVGQGNELYIIMGSYGTGGTGNNGTANTIAAGKVTVPSRVWKVIVVLPQGTDDVNRVTTITRVIAVNTPNTNNVSSAWGTYRTSVDEIEAATGYDILSKVAPGVQRVIEAKVDNGPTS